MAPSKKSYSRLGKKTKRAKSVKLMWLRKKAGNLDVANITVDCNNPTSLEDIPQVDNVNTRSNQSTSSSNPIDEAWISQMEYDEIMDHKLCVEKVCKEDVLEGRRIVSIDHVIEMCLSLGRNHASICTSGKLQIIKEHRNGFHTKIYLECDMCHREYSITSEPNSLPTPEINKLAVWGTIATGSTFSHLEELCVILDIPCLSPAKFYNIHNNLSDLWEDEALEDMANAAKEESRIATENGNVDKDGIPFITVYLDGGWSKRSYGHNYNAASGVGVIIGKQTKKVLHMGVRNKFCIICKKTPDKIHRCFKNWTGSSSAMESDIIVDGFNSSEKLHGIRYKSFIADGDSSVYANIVKYVTYGKEVKKIECSNHLIKNYGKGLYKRKNDAGLLLMARKLLTVNKIKELQRIAQRAIFKNAHGDLNSLIEDLINGPAHVFNFHQNCKEYYCTQVGETAEEITTARSSGLYTYIQGALNILVRNARSLIENESNNRAETFMSIVNRFNSGKRMNLIQRRSFQTRAFLSCLRYNQGKKWHCNPLKKVLSKKHSSKLKKYITTTKMTKKQRRHDAKMTNTRLCTTAPVVKRTVRRNLDYGIHALQPELSDIQIESECERLLEVFHNISIEEIASIEENSKEQFDSDFYKNQRHHRLTASNFGKVCRLRPTTSCHNTVKDIIQPTFFGNDATNYGKSMEIVVLHMLKNLYGKTFLPCGLFIDHVHKFLAASPDGIIREERTILEIKAPYIFTKEKIAIAEAAKIKKNFCLNEVDGNLKLKRDHHYYYQIQGQLHISNMDKCLFVIYSGDKDNLYVEEILKDDSFWENEMLEKLVKFYTFCILPEIVRGNMKRGLRCKDPYYITDQQKKKTSKINSS